MQIGFVGLGKMGGNMVHRILRDSDHEVVGWNLTPEPIREAESHGAAGAEIDERADGGPRAWRRLSERAAKLGRREVGPDAAPKCQRRKRDDAAFHVHSPLFRGESA